MRFPAAAACALVMSAGAACTFGSVGGGSPQGGVGSATEGSSGDSGAVSATGTPGDGVATEGADAGGTTDGGPDTSPQPTTAPADASSDSGGPPPVEIHLQNAGQDDCSAPLWCFSSPGGEPVGGPQWSFECFDSGLTGAYVLDRVHMFIAGRGPMAGPAALQVYGWNNGPTGEPLHEQIVLPAALPLGDATIELDTELVLTESAFCVGLTTSVGAPGAIGLGVDQSAAMFAVSFFRLQIPGNCDIPQWTDVIAYQPTPTGNWCIDAWVHAVD